MIAMLARAFALLLRNPILLVPGIVLAAFGVLVEALGSAFMTNFALATNGSADVIYALQTFGALAIFVVSAAVSLVQMMMVTAMAGAAWEHARTSLRVGWDALRHRFVPSALAAAMLLLLGICAAALSPATFMVPIILYVLLFIYTMAEVVIGEQPPIRSLVASCRLAMANPGPTLVVVGLILVISLGGAGLGALIAQASQLAGWLVAGLLQQVIIAYATLAITGEYLQLASAAPPEGL